MKGDSEAAIGFLRRFRPKQPWLLTAIDPNKKGIDTQTFIAAGDALRWIEKYNGQRNIYFSVNPANRPLSKKAEREDIRAVEYLHVDVDPRPGEDLKEEQARALALLQNPPGGVPPPTVIVFSGGGYQGFWKLSDPIEIGGDLARAEDAKRYNIQLELIFGADNCHNIDRIMRLPGTVNIPDERKRKKGREPALACLVSFADTSYNTDQFTKAPALQMPGGKGGLAAPPTQVQVSGNVERLANVEILDKWKVPDRIKVIIVQGMHPDETKAGDNSRSAWLFDAVCALVRAGLPDDMVYSIITDPDYRISESVIDKGSGSERYALRQIQRAKVVTRAKELILEPGDPLPSAKIFVGSRFDRLLYHNGDWLTYNGAAYVEIEDMTVRSELYDFLELAQQSSKKSGDEESTMPFMPTKKKVDDVVDALKGLIHRPRDQFTPPCWLNVDGPPANEVFACRNGLVHLPRGILMPGTPDFFTRNGLQFSFEPQAPDPCRWLRLMKEVWTHDQQAIDTLQEVFGYLLIPDTSQQKVFLLVGPARSGKGTIGHVLKALVGPANTCGPRLSSLGESFGLQPLLGKQLALVSDTRLGRKCDHAAIAENLLRISGEDPVDVNRKYKDTWTGSLSTRILIMTNVPPRFADTSGALVSRLVVLTMRESFLGREDPNLKADLLRELPGILNWAIEGWRRLHKRGRFELPSSSVEMLDTLGDLASPEAAFLRESCVLQHDAVTPKMEIFSKWSEWGTPRGYHAGSLDHFSSRLMAASGHRIGICKPTLKGKRVPAYRGVRLISRADAEVTLRALPF